MVSAVSSTNITIKDCYFEGNKAVSSAGVIFLATQSLIRITNSIFTEN